MDRLSRVRHSKAGMLALDGVLAAVSGLVLAAVFDVDQRGADDVDDLLRAVERQRREKPMPGRGGRPWR
jgi:hypothetical protein